MRLQIRDIGGEGSNMSDKYLPQDTGKINPFFFFFPRNVEIILKYPEQRGKNEQSYEI